MPVHLYGMPAQMDAIMAIAQEYNIPLIEDAAESLGSTYKEKFTGSIGKMGVYSFNGNKIITTSGGGALASNYKDLIDQARFLATQARDEAPHYQHSRIGYNYRLSNVLAGIGRGQMAVLDERIAQRRANFARYQNYFAAKNAAGYHILFQEENAHSFSNRWLSAILVDPALNKGLNREKIRLALGEEDIEARPLWKPMHLQPVFADCRYYGSNISETLFNQGLCLPSGSNLTDQDFDRIFAALDQLFI
jgi:dTDP-4-amino-4,6-dideoxygalactose transaminase